MDNEPVRTSPLVSGPQHQFGVRGTWPGKGTRALAALVVVLGLPIVVNQVSVQPGAALVKAAFEIRPAVTIGPGYQDVAATVTVLRNITVPVWDTPSATVDIYRPSHPVSRTLPIVLWVHGGGFISGSKAQVGPYATMLASAGYVVASLGYSVAPGARYPTPVRQANATLAYLTAHADSWGGDNTRIFIGGDSAGAQIASQLAALQTNPVLATSLGLRPAVPVANLRGAVLFCGLYDMNTVRNTGFPALRTFLWSYTGYRDWTEFSHIEELSTTAQITTSFPPTFLAVGDADPFQSQARELKAALQVRKVPVTTNFWTGTGSELGHEYQFDFSTVQAQATFRDTITFLSTHSRSADR